ncbi:unnamed protein product [Dibothriocephalus latus]|uniref:Uncharacterized protein n=1 Tax=Dibothriocephalus latus TaxID=60516 RepID=A0A3P7LV76_DIBLA|nr:unnamed protein product [Dibothriocephalus latus]
MHNATTYTVFMCRLVLVDRRKLEHEPQSSPERSRRTLDRSGACSPGVRHYDDVEVPPFASSAAATIAQYYDEGVFSGDESEAPRPGLWKQRLSPPTGHFAFVKSSPPSVCTKH